MNYSYTMPINSAKTVGARYLMGALLFGFSFVYNLVYSVILGAVSTVSYRAGDFKNQLLLLAAACLVYGFFLPLAFHFRTGRTVSAIAIGILAVVYTGTGIAMTVVVSEGAGNPSELLEIAGKIRNTGMLVCLPVAAVGIALSFLCSCRIFDRRERA
jgi:hypothetical protein